MKIGDVLYEAKDCVASITLNCSDRFNAIIETMPGDIANVFEYTNDDMH